MATTQSDIANGIISYLKQSQKVDQKTSKDIKECVGLILEAISKAINKRQTEKNELLNRFDTLVNYYIKQKNNVVKLLEELKRYGESDIAQKIDAEYKKLGLNTKINNKQQQQVLTPADQNAIVGQLLKKYQNQAQNQDTKKDRSNTFINSDMSSQSDIQISYQSLNESLTSNNQMLQGNILDSNDDFYDSLLTLISDDSIEEQNQNFCSTYNVQLDNLSKGIKTIGVDYTQFLQLNETERQKIKNLGLSDEQINTELKQLYAIKLMEYFIGSKSTINGRKISFNSNFYNSSHSGKQVIQNINDTLFPIKAQQNVPINALINEAAAASNLSDNKTNAIRTRSRGNISDGFRLESTNALVEIHVADTQKSIFADSMLKNLKDFGNAYQEYLKTKFEHITNIKICEEIIQKINGKSRQEIEKARETLKNKYGNLAIQLMQDVGELKTERLELKINSERLALTRICAPFMVNGHFIYNFTKEQKKYLEELESNKKLNTTLLVSAPVGTGKTYLANQIQLHFGYTQNLNANKKEAEEEFLKEVKKITKEKSFSSIYNNVNIVNLNNLPKYNFDYSKNIQNKKSGIVDFFDEAIERRSVLNALRTDEQKKLFEEYNKAQPKTIILDEFPSYDLNKTREILDGINKLRKEGYKISVVQMSATMNKEVCPVIERSNLTQKELSLMYPDEEEKQNKENTRKKDIEEDIKALKNEEVDKNLQVNTQQDSIIQDLKTVCDNFRKNDSIQTFSPDNFLNNFRTNITEVKAKSGYRALTLLPFMERNSMNIIMQDPQFQTILKENGYNSYLYADENNGLILNYLREDGEWEKYAACDNETLNKYLKEQGNRYSKSIAFYSKDNSIGGDFGKFSTDVNEITKYVDISMKTCDLIQFNGRARTLAKDVKTRTFIDTDGESIDKEQYIKMLEQNQAVYENMYAYETFKSELYNILGTNSFLKQNNGYLQFAVDVVLKALTSNEVMISANNSGDTSISFAEQLKNVVKKISSAMQGNAIKISQQTALNIEDAISDTLLVGFDNGVQIQNKMGRFLAGYNNLLNHWKKAIQNKYNMTFGTSVNTPDTMYTSYSDYYGNIINNLQREKKIIENIRTQDKTKVDDRLIKDYDKRVIEIQNRIKGYKQSQNIVLEENNVQKDENGLISFVEDKDRYIIKTSPVELQLAIYKDECKKLSNQLEQLGKKQIETLENGTQADTVDEAYLKLISELNSQKTQNEILSNEIVKLQTLIKEQEDKLNKPGVNVEELKKNIQSELAKKFMETYNKVNEQVKLLTQENAKLLQQIETLKGLNTQLTEQNQVLNQSLLTSQTNLESEQASRLAAETKRNELNAELQNKQNELIDVQKQYNQLKAANKNLQSQIVQLQNTQEDTDKKTQETIDVLNKKIASYLTAQQTLTQKNDKLLQQINDKNKQICDLEQNLETVKQQLEDAKDVNADNIAVYQLQVDSLTKQLETTKLGMQDAKDVMEINQKEIERLADELEKVQKDLKNTKQNLANVKQDLANTQNDLNIAQNNLDIVQGKLTLAEANLTQEKLNNFNLAAEKQTLEQNKKKLEEEKAKLEEQVGQLKKSLESVQEVQAEVLQQSKAKQQTIDDLNAQIKQFDEQIKNKDTEINNENFTIQQQNHQIIQLKTDLKKAQDDLENAKVAYQKEKDELNSEIGKLKEQIKQNNIQLQQYTLEQGKLKGQIENLEKRINDLETENEQLIKDKTTLEQTNEQFVKEKEQLQTNYDNLNTELQRLQTQQQQNSAKITQLEEQLKEEKNNNKQIEKEKQNLQQQLQQLQQQTVLDQQQQALVDQQQQTQQQELQTKINKLNVQQQNNQNIIDSLAAQIEALTQTNSDYSTQQVMLEAKIKELENKLQTKTNDIIQLNDQIAILNAQIAELQLGNKRLKQAIYTYLTDFFNNKKDNEITFEDVEQAIKDAAEQTKQDKQANEKEINALQQQLNQLEEEQEQQNQYQQQLQQQKIELNNKIKELEGQIEQQTQQQQFDKEQQQQKEKQQQLAQIEKDGQQQETVKELKQKLQQLKMQLQETQKTIKETKEQNIANIGNIIKTQQQENTNKQQKLQTQIDKLQQEVNEQQKTIKAYDEFYNTITSEETNINDNTKQANKQDNNNKQQSLNNEFIKAIYTALKAKKSDDLNKAIDDVFVQLNRKDKTIAEQQQTIDELNKEVQKYKSKVEQYKNTEEELNNLQIKYNEQLATLQQKDIEIAVLTAENDKLNKQIESLNAEIANNTNALANSHQANEVLVLQGEQQDIAINNYKQQIQDLNSRIAELQKSRSALEQDYDIVKAEKDNKIDELNAEINKLKNEIAQNKQKLAQQVQTQFEQINQLKDLYEQQIDVIQQKLLQQQLLQRVKTVENKVAGDVNKKIEQLQNELRNANDNKQTIEDIQKQLLELGENNDKTPEEQLKVLITKLQQYQTQQRQQKEKEKEEQRVQKEREEQQKLAVEQAKQQGKTDGLVEGKKQGKIQGKIEGQKETKLGIMKALLNKSSDRIISDGEKKPEDMTYEEFAELIIQQLEQQRKEQQLQKLQSQQTSFQQIVKPEKQLQMSGIEYDGFTIDKQNAEVQTAQEQLQQEEGIQVQPEVSTLQHDGILATSYIQTQNEQQQKKQEKISNFGIQKASSQILNDKTNKLSIQSIYTTQYDGTVDRQIQQQAQEKEAQNNVYNDILKFLEQQTNGTGEQIDENSQMFKLYNAFKKALKMDEHQKQYEAELAKQMTIQNSIITEKNKLIEQKNLEIEQLKQQLQQQKDDNKQLHKQKSDGDKGIWDKVFGLITSISNVVDMQNVKGNGDIVKTATTVADALNSLEKQLQTLIARFGEQEQKLQQAQWTNLENNEQLQEHKQEQINQQNKINELKTQIVNLKQQITDASKDVNDNKQAIVDKIVELQTKLADILKTNKQQKNEIQQLEEENNRLKQKPQMIDKQIETDEGQPLQTVDEEVDAVSNIKTHDMGVGSDDNIETIAIQQATKMQTRQQTTGTVIETEQLDKDNELDNIPVYSTKRLKRTTQQDQQQGKNSQQDAIIDKTKVTKELNFSGVHTVGNIPQIQPSQEPIVLQSIANNDGVVQDKDIDEEVKFSKITMTKNRNRTNQEQNNTINNKSQNSLQEQDFSILTPQASLQQLQDSNTSDNSEVKTNFISSKQLKQSSALQSENNSGRITPDDTNKGGFSTNSGADIVKYVSKQQNELIIDAKKIGDLKVDDLNTNGMQQIQQDLGDLSDWLDPREYSVTLDVSDGNGPQPIGFSEAVFIVSTGGKWSIEQKTKCFDRFMKKIDELKDAETDIDKKATLEKAKNCVAEFKKRITLKDFNEIIVKCNALVNDINDETLKLSESSSTISKYEALMSSTYSIQQSKKEEFNKIINSIKINKYKNVDKLCNRIALKQEVAMSTFIQLSSIQMNNGVIPADEELSNSISEYISKSQIESKSLSLSSNEDVQQSGVNSTVIHTV